MVTAMITLCFYSDEIECSRQEISVNTAWNCTGGFPLTVLWGCWLVCRKNSCLFQLSI